jgi:AraC-like DNA-binding protein
MAGYELSTHPSRAREIDSDAMAERALPTSETTVSPRWAVPFMRLTGASPEDLAKLTAEGIALSDFVDPDARVSHRVLMQLLTTALARTGDPSLGLRAAEQVEPADFGPVELACRSCVDVRASILCAGRYIHILHGALSCELVEQAELATWRLKVTDDVPQPPAANDFMLATAFRLLRRHAGERHALREVHFTHARATSEGGYARTFAGAVIKLGMPDNALVFDRAYLDAPLKLAHAGLQAVFELRAQTLLALSRRSRSYGGQVRELLVAQLPSGDVSMTTVARRLAVSAATLRRRLTAEGTSHSAILDELRRELAERYLADRSLALKRVAHLLGFSHVTAFYKAFRRWSDGGTPTAFREQRLRHARGLGAESY